MNKKKTYPVPPSPGHFELRIFSGVPDCKYVLTTNLTEYPEVHLNSIDYWLGKEIRTENGKLTVAYSFVDENKEGCPKFPGGRYTFQERKSYSIFLQDKINDPLVSIYDEEVEKSSKANPLVRNLANVDKNRNIAWKPSNSDEAESTQKANYRKLIELRAHTYDIMVDNVKVYDVKLRHGGVYSLVIGSNTDGTFTAKIFEVTEPNSMNILWLVPQYVVMTLGEVMFSVTGLEFSYSQAPVTMKSVLQACWLLTVAFGNIIVVIIAEAKFFKSQASEFFLFAGLMFADMFIFMYVAYRYKPNNPNDVLKKQDECNDTNNDSLEQQRREHFIRNQRQQQATTLPAIQQQQQQQHPWTTDQNQSGKSSRYTKRQID